MRLRSGLNIIPECLRMLSEEMKPTCSLCWDTCLDAVVDTLHVFEVATHTDSAVYSPDPPMCGSSCTLRHLHNNHCCTLYMCGDTVSQLGSDAHSAQM